MTILGGYKEWKLLLHNILVQCNSPGTDHIGTHGEVTYRRSISHQMILLALLQPHDITVCTVVDQMLSHFTIASISSLNQSCITFNISNVDISSRVCKQDTSL